jgi:iron complex outermembrane receptor protein
MACSRSTLALRSLLVLIASTGSLLCTPGATARTDEDPPPVRPTARPLLSDLAALEAPEGLALDNELAELDLEDLFAIEVTSVAGSARPILGTPSAITRITPRDIERTGYRHLADVLRLAPGVDVGRISNNQWGVTVRGFNDVIANKLQVQVDGRSVYTTGFSGTLWETLDLPLYDLESIEVVRGPGATLWGENAVNGVVSVRSKSAFDTLGVHLQGRGGTAGVAGDARYGGMIGEDTAFRIYVRGSELSANELVSSPRNSADDSMMGSGGFRLDRRLDDATTFTLDGRAFNEGRFGKDARVPVLAHLTRAAIREDNEYTGGHVRARLERRHENGTGWYGQLSVDRLETDRFGDNALQDGIDASFQATTPLGDEAFLTWGAQYLTRRTSIDADAQVTLVGEQDRWDDTVSAFLQAELPVGGRDDLTAIIGSKFSHNSFSGFEIQPSARLAWTPTEDFAAWGAVSRAVRTPSLVDRDVLFVDQYADTGLLAGGPPSGVLVPIGNSGNPDTESEELLALEAGIRWRPAESLTLDLATYYNDYDQLRVLSPFTTNFNLGNNGRATAWGGELELVWQAAETWRLVASYSLLQLDATADRSTIRTTGTSPQQMAQLRSSWDVREDLRLDTVVAWTDERPYFAAIGGAAIPSAFRLDAGLTWRPRPGDGGLGLGPEPPRPRHPRVQRGLLRVGHGGPRAPGLRRTHVPVLTADVRAFTAVHSLAMSTSRSCRRAAARLARPRSTTRVSRASRGRSSAIPAIITVSSSCRCRTRSRASGSSSMAGERATMSSSRTPRISARSSGRASRFVGSIAQDSASARAAAASRQCPPALRARASWRDVRAAASRHRVRSGSRRARSAQCSAARRAARIASGIAPAARCRPAIRERH